MTKLALILTASLLIAGCGAQPQAVTGAHVASSGAQAEGIFNRPVKVEKLLAEVLMKYDHNRNGVIELRKPAGFLPPFLRPDERLRQETTRVAEKDRNGRVIRVVYTTHTYTRRDMFYSADTNRDDVVTRQELQALVASFDKDQDGELTRRGVWGWVTRKEKGEHDRLNDQYGEELIETDRREFSPFDAEAMAGFEADHPLVDTVTPAEELKPKAL